MCAERENTLVLLGGGGHASVVADSATAAGWSIAGFFDDDGRRAPLAGASRGATIRRLGSIGDAASWLHQAQEKVAVHAAIGDGQLRARWLERIAELGKVVSLPPIIHPSAVVSASASIGDAAFIGPKAIVNAGARVGRGAIINSGAIIEHDVEVGAFGHVAPGAAIGGEARIGAFTLIGIGGTVLPGVEVGRHAVLGAGATLVTPLADNVIAIGIPARVVRTRS